MGAEKTAKSTLGQLQNVSHLLFKKSVSRTLFGDIFSNICTIQSFSSEDFDLLRE